MQAEFTEHGSRCKGVLMPLTYALCLCHVQRRDRVDRVDQPRLANCGRKTKDEDEDEDEDEVSLTKTT